MRLSWHQKGEPLFPRIEIETQSETKD